MASDPNIPDPNDPSASGATPEPGADAGAGGLTPDELAKAQAAAAQSLSNIAEPGPEASAAELPSAEGGAAESSESDPPPAAISAEELEAALRNIQAADAGAAETASADVLVAAAGESAPPMSDVEAAMMAMLDSEGAGAGAAAAPPPSPAAPPPPTQPFELPSLSAGRGEVFSDLSLLDDVELDVKIELGRTDMYIEDVLKLGVGSVIELDRLAGDPVDIYVNERLVARGEVLVLNDNFCVRINDIVSPVPELEVHP